MRKSILGAMCGCLAVVSFNTGAAIISVDWKTAGDNLITRDTDTGLEWLDLTETYRMNYNNVSSQLGVGGQFEGWRYAISDEIIAFLDAFGGDSQYYESGWSEENNGLFQKVSSFWGDVYCQEYTVCNIGEGQSVITMGEAYVVPGYHWSGRIGDTSELTGGDPETQDYVVIGGNTWIPDYSSNLYGGSALVRDITIVPIPAAVWLFGSGLIGLIGMARRKKV